MAGEEPEEGRSRAAGGCVLAVLAGAGLAGVWAASATAGVLVVWVAGLALVWWSVRHTANPAPPPGSGPLSDGEEAGQDGVRVVRREGMLIYLRPDPDQPTRTHVRVEQTADDSTA